MNTRFDVGDEVFILGKVREISTHRHYHSPVYMIETRSHGSQICPESQLFSEPCYKNKRTRKKMAILNEEMYLPLFAAVVVVCIAITIAILVRVW